MGIDYRPTFAKGEISSDLFGRIDLQLYREGATRIENFMVMPQGGVTRLPGSIYIFGCRSADSIMIPFIFNRKQAYGIEFGGVKCRFFYNRELILTGPETAYEIDNPYANEDLSRVRWVQQNDVMYLFHPDYITQKLSRLGHTNWVMTDLSPTDGPFLNENVTKTNTVQASGTFGAVTLTAAGGNVWTVGDVGSLFRMRLISPDDGVGAWNPGSNYPEGETVYYGDNYYLSIDANAVTGTTPPTHLEGEAWDGQLTESHLWEYLHSGFGVARITSVISPTHALATVLSDLPNQVVTAPTYRWSRGAWSDRQGYPSDAVLTGERLIPVATAGQPLSVFGSVAQTNYERYEEGTDRSDAYIHTIGSRQSDLISFIDSLESLVIGTPSGIYSLTGDSFDTLPNPIDKNAKVISYDGAAAKRPAQIGSSIFYISNDNMRLFELFFAGGPNQGGYATEDRTLIANHIARPGNG